MTSKAFLWIAFALTSVVFLFYLDQNLGQTLG